MSQNQFMESFNGVKRKAVDSTGCLGRLYDMRQEIILKEWNKTIQGQVFTVSEKPYCKLMNGSIEPGFNLLQFIDIENELRVNLLLKATKRLGIAAVMNYHRPIDKWTRILYYSYINREEQVIDIADVSKMLESSDPQRHATHVITGIDYGIDLVVIVQLQSKTNIVTKIDDILRKTRNILLGNNDNICTLTNEENLLLERNTNITVYSNAPFFTGLNRISDILDKVDRKKNCYSCHPISYYLQVTQQLHSHYRTTLKAIEPALIEQIEQCLLEPRTPIQYLDGLFKDNFAKRLCEFFQNPFYNVKQYYSSLKNQYEKMVNQLSHIMPDLYSGQYNSSIVYSVLRDDGFSKLKNNIYQLIRNMPDSEEQNSSISQSQQYQPYNYGIPVEQSSYKNNSITNIGIVFERNDPHDKSFHINYASDNTINSNQKDFGQMSGDNDSNNSVLRSNSDNQLYPLIQLQSMMSRSDNIRSNENQLQYQTPPPADAPQTPVLPELFLPETDEIIHILLLGETGVGKSTFINAFVNYLSFDTFEQAELNKPVVLIPVSFMMTVGANFDERIVKFGDVDSEKNEDFDHPGQSVTQHCKSYIFHRNDGKKLCIIDTPGFGDTRGLEQDDHNMQNILEYINNINHLNAICFLLKPNSSRLNIFFRSCLTQILDLLGPNICRNITFCFTNARATFYTPGDTAPLLKSMLKSLSINDIPFEKENTFCFDNESFRYLVALRNNISFNEVDKQDYEKSWSTSVKESNRLIDYILTKLILYPKRGEWQSIKHAQFEITYMIRPILEAMRNILRNIILQNKISSNKSIELCPIVIHRSAFLCLLCKQDKIELDNFSITLDCPHEFQNQCLHCHCSRDHHIPIDYILKYKLMNNSSNHSRKDMNDTLNQLCEASVTFAYFLIHIAHSTKEDPFETGLTRMIFQENEFCQYQESNNFNSQLAKELLKLQAKYIQNNSKMKPNREHISLTHVYDLMNDIRRISIIETQMSAVRRGREIIMKQYENEHEEI